MAFPGYNYAPPGPYTQTFFENPVAGAVDGLKIPVFVGEGNEILLQSNLEVVRGSSSSIDQQVVLEDETGRAVVSVSNSGEITHGDFNGVLTKFQVRNFPIVSGNGTGTTTNDRSSVSVTINGQAVVVVSVTGSTGVVELAQAPKSTDLVRCTYFFNRTDTLITDTLSSQVTTEVADLKANSGHAAAGSFSFDSTNNQFKLTVDRGSEETITIPLGGSGTSTYTAVQLASLINGLAIESLTATTFTNNQGETALNLLADEDIVIGAGSANATLGFEEGQSTSRNRVFYTYNGPIVDGTNGGVTTTDTSKLTVLVDNVQVIPTSVNGSTRAITLPFAPKSGAIVVVTYWFNTWQNTFDYLANIGVTEVVRAGLTPDRNDYVDRADFILKDDTIIWGTAALVSSGVHTTGKEYFGSKQITTTLIDNQTYLSPCTAVVDTSTVPTVQSSTVFTLPYQPTTGNGRNTPLGTSLFQTVSNSRIDLPTDRPDLVTAYWGYSVQDALDRGSVTVLKVNSSTSQITLRDPVPLGATVYASFYYNLLTDETYTLTTLTPGSSGTGTYTIQDSSGNDIYNATFNNSTKGAGLTGITIEFPSGSELTPDLRLESASGSALFTGPVEEIVTVTFADKGATPAKYAVVGSDPYEFVNNQSDKLRIKFDNADLVTGANGVDLGNPTARTCGFFASLLGEEVEYDASTGGASYTLAATDNEASVQVDGVILSATVAAGAGKTLADFVTALNTAAVAGGTAAPVYKGSAEFNGPYVVTASEYDQLTLHYNGDVSGASGNNTITLAPGTYANAAALATQINTQLATINGGVNLVGSVTCTADGNSRMVFAFAQAGADASGFFEFVANAAPARDFATVCGIDTAAATLGGQTKILDGSIARRFTVGAAPLESDRLILRNRILPGGGGSMSPHNSVSQTELVVLSASGNTKSGLTTDAYGKAHFQASMQAPSLLGRLGFAGGQMVGAGDASDSQPAVTFYDGTGANAANNVFKFTLDGVPVAVTFIASAAGTLTALGPFTVADTVMDQIVNAMATIPGTPFGNEAAIEAALYIRQDGDGIRITSPTTTDSSEIVIGDGNANTILGFTEGSRASVEKVEAAHVAGALMSQAQSSGNFALMLHTYASPAATYFAAEGLAGVIKDSANSEFLYLQSQSLGAGSQIEFAAATTQDALYYGTLLGEIATNGSSGEAGISGFYVVSTDPNGSGSADTSVLNSGTGQDGNVGQTYRDAVTGLTFTILPRAGGLNYPTAAATFRFQVSKTVTTNANIPITALLGVETIVANTTDVGVGDTALVEMFERGGQEPSIGDLYYVTYRYTKQDYTTQLYTKLSAIEAAFGEATPDYPVSLASYLAILNGALLMGIKQTPKESGSQTASVSTYTSAIDDLAKPLPGGLSPDIIVPLRGDSLEFFQFLSLHLDLQSSLRYRKERTAINGFSGGTDPDSAGLTSEAISAGRMRFVYPDTVTLNLTDALNNTKEYLIEGPYMSAALAGSVVSPNLDVATPWTGRNLVGFNELGRKLDAVEQNTAAVRGLTILEDAPPFIRIRQGFTSDMTNILTKTPTITQIADEVQRQSRNAMLRFIGIKFLPGVITQIEGRLAKVLQDLQKAQIIAAYTGVEANVTEDPTLIESRAFYAPIFPILYILLTFHLRSRV